MRLIIFVLVLFAISNFSIKAQNYVTIGNGTGNTNGSSSTKADPVERYNNYQHFQMLYLASELSAAGLPAGAQITALGFSISESADSLMNFTISMGNTNAITAFNNYVSDLTVVKTSFTYRPVVKNSGEFDMITFTSPFIWDGISNIVINTCTGYNIRSTLAPYTGAGGLRYTLANNLVNYRRSASDCCVLTTSGSTGSYRPNISFAYTPPNCTPLTLPWSENFDQMGTPGYPIGSGILPYSWKSEGYVGVMVSGEPLNTWTSCNASSTPHSDPYSSPNYMMSYCISWGSDDYLITPGFNLTGGSTYLFSLKFMGEGSNAWDADVRYNTAPTGIGSTQIGSPFLSKGTFSPETYQDIIRQFTPTTSGQYYFMIHKKCNLYNVTESWNLGFDDFRLLPDLSPNCQTPENIYCSALTHNSVQVSWNPVSSLPANGYQYYCSTSSVVPAETATPSGTCSAASTLLTGLNPDTKYYVWVRPDCGSGQTSVWSNYALFSTLLCPSTITLPYIQNFSSATVPGLPTCTSAENAGGGNMWVTRDSSGQNNYFLPVTQAKNLIYISSGYHAANAWFFTQGINMMGHKTYKISYLYAADAGYWNQEKMKVTVGAGASSIGATTLAYYYITSSTLTRDSIVFIPDSSGVYYFGFNCYSDMNMGALQLDDIKVDSVLCNQPLQAAGNITGSPLVCQGATSVSYSIPVIPVASSYTWQFSGTNYTGLTNNIVINFGQNATSGSLAVFGVNACGRGKVSPVFNIQVDPILGDIHSINGSGLVCQGETNVAFSVPSVPGASSYIWSYSGTGATIVGSTNNVIINFAPNATSGILTVYGSNSCSNSSVSPDFPITINPVSPPPVASGNTRCGAGSVVLSAVASSGGTLKWYGTSTGGTCLGTGSTFNTPSLSTTTSYYVEEENEFNALLPVTFGNETFISDPTINYFGTLSPFLTSEPGARHQFLLSASEMINTGLKAGNFTSLAFEIQALVGLPMSDFNVSLGLTSINSLTETFESNFTNVFSAQTYIPSGLGWQYIDFTTPFYWDGVSNIIIQTCFQNTTWSENTTVYYSFTQTNTQHCGTPDNGESACTMTDPFIEDVDVRRANIKIRGNVTNICTSLRTAVTAIIIPSDASPIAGNNGPVCTGTTLSLTASTISGSTYAWTGVNGFTSSLQNPIVSSSATPAMAGTYSVTVSANGCTSQASTTTVLINLAPIITSSVSLVSICEGNSSALTASSNITPATYTWMPGGIYGSSVSVTPAATTTYTVTGIVAATGCSGTSTVTINVNPKPIITPIAIPATICNGASTSLAASSNITGTTYAWNPGNLIGTTVSVTPSSTTIYTVNGTVDFSGCSGTSTVAVTVYPVPVITPTVTPGTICSGASSSLAATSSINPATFTWVPGNLTGTPVTVTPASDASYTVTGTVTGTGCTGTSTVLVTVNPDITPTFNPVAAICSGATLAALPITSLNGITGTWTPSLNNTVTTTYTFIPEVGQCATTTTLTITVNPNFTPTFNPVSPICSGTILAALPTTSTNGYTGTWEPVMNNNATTTYTFTSTAEHCATTTLTIYVNPNPVISLSATPSAICHGASSSLSASSTVVGTTYNWTPGNLSETTISVSPALNTTYTVTGTVNGCVGTSTVTVTVNSNPVLNPIATPNPICRFNNTVLSVIPEVNTTYLWMPGNLSGASQPNIHPVVTKIYSITGTNTLTNCSTSATVTVIVNQNPVITAGAAPTITCSNGSSTLTTNCLSNCTGMTYLWMPGSYTGSSISVHPLVTTIYTVTGTNSGGCTQNTTVTLTVNPKPVITPTATLATICSGASSSLSASSDIVGTSFLWIPGSLSGTPVSVSPGSNTTYTVTGTVTASGCTGTSTVTVTVNPTPVNTPSATPAIINSGSSSSLTASSNIGGTTFIWNPGSLIGSPVTVSPLATTTYSVTGTSPAGCTGTNTATVIVNPLTKNLQIKVFVEGLYMGSGMMHESNDYDPLNENFPPKWYSGISDTLTVVLYNNSYDAVMAKYPGVYLHTDGNLIIPGIVASLNGSYYITIFHRNSVPITSAIPQPFTSNTITYDFTYPIDQAYGVGLAPQKDLGDGFYGMYTGELDHDSYFVIDGSDVSILDPDIISGPYGYILTDLNGDGVVDGSDMSLMDANSIFGPLFWNPKIGK